MGFRRPNITIPLGTAIRDPRGGPCKYWGRHNEVTRHKCPTCHEYDENRDRSDVFKLFKSNIGDMQLDANNNKWYIYQKDGWILREDEKCSCHCSTMHWSD